MEITDFRKEFLEQIAALAVSDGNFKRSAFVEYGVQLLENAEEVSDFEACYYRGRVSKNKALAIDGFAFDDAGGSGRSVLAQFGGSKDSASLSLPQAGALLYA